MTQKNNDYQGWKNFQTFVIGAEITGTKTTLDYIISLGVGKDAHEFAREIEEYFEDDSPALPSPYHDLLDNALEAVCWLEIAEELKERYQINELEEGAGEGEEE